jgi:uncharacterized protein (DUF433 family)
MEQELHLAHPLAHDRLVTDGAEVLYDFGARLDPDGIRGLVSVRAGERVLAPAVLASLSRIHYAADGWAEQLKLPGYAHAEVVVGATLGRGRPVLVRSRVPVEDVVGRWITGDSIADLAEGFGLGGAEVEDVVRAATRRCAAA